MKKLLPLMLLVVLLVGCEEKDAKTPRETDDSIRKVGRFYLATEDTETPNDAVWDSNDIFTIDPNSELVRNLNLRYDPNFYSIITETPTIDKAVWLQITIKDVNNVTEAASYLRKMDTRNAKEVIDIEVVIGNETHTATFEEFFEWMGFKR